MESELRDMSDTYNSSMYQTIPSYVTQRELQENTSFDYGMYAPSNYPNFMATPSYKVAASSDQYRPGTDGKMIIIFMITILSSFFVAWPLLQSSDTLRLNHGWNFQTQLCGVTDGVISLPFLFWPVDPQKKDAVLMKDRAKCIKRCPTLKQVKKNETTTIPIQHSTTAKDLSSGVQMQFNLLSPLYETMQIGSLYCIPTDPSLAKQLPSNIASLIRQTQLAMGSLLRAWPLIFFSLMIIVVLNMLFYAAAKEAPFLLVWTLPLFTIICLGLSGVYFTISGFRLMNNPYRFSLFFLDPFFSVLLGIIFFVCSLILIPIYLLSQDVFEKSARMLECCGETLAEIPTLLLSPTIFSSVLTIVFYVFTFLFSFILSAGDSHIVNDLTLNQDTPPTLLPIERNFSWHIGIPFVIMIFVFLFCWISEILFSFSQFVTSFLGTTWYFADPSLPRRITGQHVLWAIFEGGMCHFGSFALSGLVMGFSRFIRICFGWTHRYSLFSRQNFDIVETFKDVFAPVLQTLEHINNTYDLNGYVEMAFSAKPFYEAMQTASVRCDQAQSCSPYVLKVTRIITTMGTLTMSLICALCSHLILIQFAPYGNVKSFHFIPFPFFVSMIIFLLSLITSSHFTSMWDMMSQVLLYCDMIETTNVQALTSHNYKHCPQSFQEFILDLQQEF